MEPRIHPLPRQLDLRAARALRGDRGRPARAGTPALPLTAADGSLRGPFDALLLSPAVGTALQEVGAAIRYRRRLTDRRPGDRDPARRRALGQRVRTRVARGDRPRTRGSQTRSWTRPRGGCRAFEGRAAIGPHRAALLDGDLDDEPGTSIRRPRRDGVFELTVLVGYYATLALQLRVFRVD